MEYKFFLNDLEIEEPIGWADFELSMNRDDIYHGMQFEVSTGALGFFGVAADYLEDQKDNNGIFSTVNFIAQDDCEGDFQTIIEGRLNFGKYKDSCGNKCLVYVPFEEKGCKVVFKNRFDQKVDLDSLVALDNITLLPNYTQMGLTMPMPAVALDARVEAFVAEEGNREANFPGDPIPPGWQTDCTIDEFNQTRFTFMRPDYLDEKFNAMATSQFSGGNDCNNPFPITPQFLYDETDKANRTCFSGELNLQARLKGEYLAIGTEGHPGNTVTIKGQVFLWNGEGVLQDDMLLLAETNIVENVTLGTTGPFDVSFDLNLTFDQLRDNPGLYVTLSFVTGVADHIVTRGGFDPETFFRLSAKKLCPDSDVQYYMIHETLSRITESITNRCMRVRSELFGRIDSQPFSFDTDGCGGMLMVTSGLKLRKAPNAKFFCSAKDLISGLNAIYNIGFGIEDDPLLPGKSVLVIEDVSFFYKNTQLLLLDSIAEVNNEIQESMHVAKVNVGYKKWETEEINGLNEFNSNREYRTNAETINTTLEITSGLVAGSSPIEITRQQSFADSGAADTTYDNETFVICLNRNAYDFSVEQNEILNPANIFDPPTTLNFRISPMRNLMRWFKSIINTYPNINSSGNRLYFNAGTGNFIAEGLLDDPGSCRLENNTIAENASLGITNFTNTTQGTPLFKNETTSFEYPLSIGQYMQLKANPYGYIAYTCGNSSVVNKGFIKEIKFRPARGMANFTLRKKWE